MQFRPLLLVVALTGCAHNVSDRLPASTIHKYCETTIPKSRESGGFAAKMTLTGKAEYLSGTLVMIEEGNNETEEELYSGTSEEFPIRPGLFNVKDRQKANPPLNSGERVVHQTAERLKKTPEMKLAFDLEKVTIVRLNMGQYDGGIASIPNYIVEAYGKGLDGEKKHLGDFVQVSGTFVGECK